MPNSLSGVDAISPAIDHAKRLLFTPFRFGRWVRIAILGFFTGEMGAGGGFNPASFQIHSGGGPVTTGGEGSVPSISLPDSAKQRLLEFLPLILAGVLALIFLVLFFMYVSSVFRFILLECVAYDRWEIRKGWKRWQEPGNSYFLWQLGYGVFSLLVMALLAVPVLAAYFAGLFREPEQHLPALILGGIALFLVFLAAMIALAVGGVFTKDFVVPVMALEKVRVLEGWRRFWRMLTAQKGAYTIYILMKIVLAIGAAIIFGIAGLVVMFVVLIPACVLGLVAVFAGAAAGLTWNAVTISLVVLAVVLLVLLLIFLAGLVWAPEVVFFQSYALHFLGSRYVPLGNLMFPAPPAPPAMAPAPAG